MQAILIRTAPEQFFSPPSVGHKGWIGCRLDPATDWPATDWPATDRHEVEALIRRGYRMTAPKRLARLVADAV